jgi:hypothetical protein
VPIPKAAPANPKVWKSSGKAPFQVLHFSDVHIDRQYTVTSHSICQIREISIDFVWLSLVQKQIAQNQYAAGTLPTIRALLLFQQVQMANPNATLLFPWLTPCWNLRKKLAVVRISQFLPVTWSKVSPVHGNIYKTPELRHALKPLFGL